MITVHNVEQGSEEWHKLRKGLWTGSRAIKLLQCKPLPDDSSTYQSGAMRRGKVLEPMALQEYAVQTGSTPQTVGFVTSSKYPNAGYSPDGIDGNTLLEIKCLNGERHDDLVNGNIPLEYLAQIYFGMAICELPKAKLLAFNPECTEQLTMIDIPRDKAIIKNIERLLSLDAKSRERSS